MHLKHYEFRAFNCYLFIKWLSRVVISSIFTNITIIHEERLPLYGPLIVVGNHNNQFVDAALLIYAIPRQMCFLVAAKTLKRKLIGTLCSLAGCISVYRPDDFKYTGVGKIVWEKGSKLIVGKDTKFTLDLNVGDKLQFGLDYLPIVEIMSDTQLLLANEVEKECPDEEGVPFSVIPKLDQSETYEQVSASLKHGNSIVIFPEGGSHDRTNLLPLKPGVALMAFYSILDGAEDVVILPLGLIYDAAKKDQTEATIYYGNMITITEDEVKLFERDRRAVVTRLLNKIEMEINNCMITAPDIQIKQWIDLCASLYPPERTKVPVNIAFDLKKFISRVFWKCGDSKETLKLIECLSVYKKRLSSAYLHDDEVWLLKQSMYSAFLMFLENVIRLLCYSVIGFSFSPLWVPLYLFSNFMAEKHRIKALKNSSVKLEGSDVYVSFKCLVLIAVVPLLNIALGLGIGLYYYGDFKRTFYTLFCCVTFLPLLYYVNLQYARKIPRLLRQLHVVPLIAMGRINIWRETERELITMRTELQLLVRDFVHKLGPKVSDNFLNELNSVFPRVLIDSDTSRISSSREHYMPIFARQHGQITEEVLQSFLSINYLNYFYHVFPLHVNTFGELFSGVITPKLDSLRSCITHFTSCHYHIDNYKYEIQNLYPYINKTFIKSTESFKSFIYNIDTGKLLEPYVKILIDAIDHDIGVLTNLYNYSNILGVYIDYLIENIKNYYKKSLLNLYNKISCFCRFYPNHSLMGKVFHDINYIKSVISRFLDYESVRQYYYSLKYIITSIKDVNSKLESFSKCLKTIQPSQADYVDQIKEKLKDYEKPTFYYLYNIEKLDPIKPSPEYLSILRENIRDIRNDIKHLKKNISQTTPNLRIVYNDLSSKIHKSDNYKKMTKVTYFLDSQFYSKDLNNLINHKIYLHTMLLHNLKSFEFIDSIISDINLIMEYIPNLRQKLLNAESKLDKKKYIEHLLDLLDFENIRSIESIDCKYNNLYKVIKDKKNIIDDVGRTFINSMIMKSIFVIHTKLNDPNISNLIKNSIKQSYAIIIKLLSMYKCINELKSINCKLDITNINIYMDQIKSILTTIENVLKKLDINMIQQIENKISQIKEIKRFNLLGIFKDFKTKNIVNLLDDLISILNSIKSLVKELKCFRQKLLDKLKCCENKIKELECAIACDMIRCSLKSLSNHIRNSHN